MMRTFALALSFAVLFGATSQAGDRGRGRGNNDQDIARRAFQRGEVLPIAQILALVPQHLPGDIVEVELDARNGRLYYEITVLTPRGRVRELVLDARTGAFV